ncbi:MAG: NAD-glutamate dehydrogenase [Pseudomonadales bacterium]
MSTQPYGATLAHLVGARLASPENHVASTFATLFWSKPPEEDLALRTLEDDVAATIEYWRQFRTLDSGATSVVLSNPVHARGGWTSAHTCVRVHAPDMPFLVDSLLMVFAQAGLTVHFLNNVVFDTQRDATGTATGCALERNGGVREVFILVETDRVSDDELVALKTSIELTLQDVTASVRDFPAMRTRLKDWIDELTAIETSDSTEEAIAFLHWLGDNHFTFLGYREFHYAQDTIEQVADSALGTLRLRPVATVRRLSEQAPDTRDFLLEPTLLSFSKSGTLSRVHRPAYPDYVGLRQVDANGRVIGEKGFLGLYTSRVYLEHPVAIPTVRRKVERVQARAGLDPNGFDGKVLAQVLATYPRDELLQIDEDELFQQALAITHIHERRRTRVFTRFDRYGLFVTCLVYLPRDLYNTSVRERIHALLMEAYGASHAVYQPYFSESILVRLHFTLRVQPGMRASIDPREIEARIVAITSDWSAELATHLINTHGEADGRRLVRAYANGFSTSYRDACTPRFAVDDIAFLEQVTSDLPLVAHLHRRPEEQEIFLHIRLFHAGNALPLSDVIPALENMGLRVINESSHVVLATEDRTVNIQDFLVQHATPVDLAANADRFADAMTSVWFRDAENDRFNQLLFAAGLDRHWIGVLRAYARYHKQLRFGFSLDFIADTLATHPSAALLLREIFACRFDPDRENTTDTADLERAFNAYVDGVQILNEDRALRRLLELVQATDRTNFYQHGRRVLALKMAPARISGIPLPVPAHEIFVTAPHVEGVHLRGGPIARGGLRWSDRLEDFRTEVLGLVKAQTVKNAVIVPTGAKGGFVVRDPAPKDRLAEGKRCYADFVGGLLDLTDNMVGGNVVTPPNTRCHDAPDSYLVVAADKGTATFSDLANSIALARNFWLGDAFASGGSNGYDHKQMGITARGAWISVRRHFAEKGIDVQEQSITVLGIGDMAGDVFGNGMLLSRAIALVAAFNHQHIFVDPSPEPAPAHAERARLFALERSTWEDYDRRLLSPGGGIFRRDAKRIPISQQMRDRFHIDATELAPDELIHALLSSPVDLIWNGGIGTYVRADNETDDSVGDRANDALRVTASRLRCGAIGEGGNLGLTQAARIAFSSGGGRVNTDFIDNSAGVDCSDHEVNIKILLNELVANGDLTLKHRNRLLLEMTGEVADLVLENNTQQALALSLAERHSRPRQDEYRRFIINLERNHGLNRRLEGLASDDELRDRIEAGGGFTRPELAVMLAWSKMVMKRELAESSLPADPIATPLLQSAFPASLVAQFARELSQHKLRAGIVATQAANKVVRLLGITSTMHLREMVGGSTEDVVRAFLVVDQCLSLEVRWTEIDECNAQEDVRLEMRLELTKLARHATRWLLRHRRADLRAPGLASDYTNLSGQIGDIRAALSGPLRSAQATSTIERWEQAGADASLAQRCTQAVIEVAGLAVASAASAAGLTVPAVGSRYGELGELLYLDDLSSRLVAQQPDSHWQAMERDILVEDVMQVQARLAAEAAKDGRQTSEWLEAQGGRTGAWRTVISDLTGSHGNEFAMLSMACRKLQDLWQLV